MTGCVAATANLISLMSLSAELSGWMRGEVLDTPFLVFCLSLLVAYAFSKRFVALTLTTAFSALAGVRRRFLLHVTLGVMPTSLICRPSGPSIWATTIWSASRPCCPICRSPPT